MQTVTPGPARPGSTALRRAGRAFATYLAIIVATLVLLEPALRIADVRVLRDGLSERDVSFRHDDELGWVPIPNSKTTVTAERMIHVQHNSLGLRDIELGETSKPRIMFVGDSFVWGNDVEAAERFTDLLRAALPDYDIVNAGVSGYGTDQELLLLQRLWPRIKPAVVVLTVVANDRADNSSNVRYDGYFKPYFATLPDGTLQLRGQPPPRPRQLYFRDNWLVRNVWIARAAVFAYIGLAHQIVTVPDPTERLIGRMRDFVEARGAKFLVGLQSMEPAASSYLAAQGIPYTAFDGAESYQKIEYGFHWTPAGHTLVAQKVKALLAQAGVHSAR